MALSELIAIVEIGIAVDLAGMGSLFAGGICISTKGILRSGIGPAGIIW